MKYKGKITDPLDLVTKQYVDNKTSTLSVTLTAAGWVENEQTISNAYFIANGYKYDVTANPANAKEYAGAFIIAQDVDTNGQMTFTCETVPENNLSVYITRTEVLA